MPTRAGVSDLGKLSAKGLNQPAVMRKKSVDHPCTSARKQNYATVRPNRGKPETIGNGGLCVRTCAAHTLACMVRSREALRQPSHQWRRPACVAHANGNQGSTPRFPGAHSVTGRPQKSGQRGSPATRRRRLHCVVRLRGVINNATHTDRGISSSDCLGVPINFGWGCNYRAHGPPYLCTWAHKSR